MKLHLPSHLLASVGHTVSADYFSPPDGPKGPVNELVAFSPHVFNGSVKDTVHIHFTRSAKGENWECVRREIGENMFDF